jgi:hypothetical protein
MIFSKRMFLSIYQIPISGVTLKPCTWRPATFLSLAFTGTLKETNRKENDFTDFGKERK